MAGTTKCDCCGSTPCSSKKTQIPIITTVNQLIDMKCGGHQWRVNFTLPELSCNGGWFIQEIDLKYEQKDKKGIVVFRRTSHFYEAWEVKKCSKVEALQHKYGFVDEYRKSPSPPNTSGFSHTVGKVKFFEVTLPSDFIKNNVLTQAEDRLSTIDTPTFWDVVALYII